MILYEKGSEWRIWDLHIHTPETKLSNNYITHDTTDPWDKFCEYIENSEVSVFGITDYFCVKNYFKFIEIFKNKYPQSNKIFFPNIELRLEVSVNSAAEEVHIHIIFDNNNVEKTEIENFLSRLDTNKTRQGAKVPCSNLVPGEFESACIDYKDIRVKLEEVFGDRQCYLIFAAANNSGLRATNSPRKMGISDEIDKVCDGFFGGAQNIEYFLKIDRYESGEESTAKPVISGSDCHSFNELEAYLGKYVQKDGVVHKNINWIKADCTFEGLKQIIYEPVERIKIQETNPKLSYDKPYFESLVIENNIQIFNKDILEFSENKKGLMLNPNLVAIIGGRGTGKSILINYIASSFGLTNINFVRSPEFKINVSKSTLTNEKSVYTNSSDNELNYLFIKQGELKLKADDVISLSKEIKDLLNIPNLSFSQAVQTEIENILKSINSVKLWFSTSDEDGHLIYNRSYNEKIINSNEQLIESITTEGNREKLERYTSNVDAIQKCLKDTEALTAIKNLIETSLSAIQETVNKVINEYPIDRIDTAVQMKQIENHIINISQKSSQLSIENNDIRESFKSVYSGDLSALLRNVETYKSNIAQAKSRLILIDEKEKENQDLIQKRNSIGQIISNEYLRQKNLIDHAWSKIDEQFENETHKELIRKILRDRNINISGEIYFNQTEFVKQLKNCLNLQQFKDTKAQSSDVRIVEEFDIHTIEDLSEFISNAMDSYYSENNYKIKDINLFENLIFSLTSRSNYLTTIPVISYKGKSLNRLSAGQRGTVYLCIKLATNAFSTPIIFDQPEDDLDNEFIIKELVDIFKEIKKYRQVIISTHNANLVVNADAEQVIVAQNNEEKLSYISGSIENPTIVNNICDILEGGRQAFKKRKSKYNIK